MNINSVDDFTNLVMSEVEDRTLDGGLSLDAAKLLSFYELQHVVIAASSKHYGVSWKKVPRSYVRSHVSWSLPFLDSIGLLYYLPLFLIYSFAESLSAFDGEVLEPVLIYWEVASRKGMQDKHKKVFGNLSVGQKRVVACYFKLLEDNYHPGEDTEDVKAIPKIRAFFAGFWKRLSTLM